MKLLLNLFSGLAIELQQQGLPRKCNFNNDYYGDQQCQKIVEGGNPPMRSGASHFLGVLTEKAYFQP